MYVCIYIHVSYYIYIYVTGMYIMYVGIYIYIYILYYIITSKWPIPRPFPRLSFGGAGLLGRRRSQALSLGGARLKATTATEAMVHLQMIYPLVI